MNNQTEQQPPPRPPNPPGFLAHKPGRAAVCAIIPGIGAVYNREYVKAVVHFCFFAALTMISEAVEIFGLAAFAFYVFTIIDAYRSADAIAQAEASGNLVQSEKNENLNLLLWGGVLILLGVLFLLDNLGAIYLRDAVEYWPILLIGLGIYLIVTQFHSSKPPVAAPNSESNREGE
jgi:hypothetical protein